MSKESQPKKPRSTKKVTEGSNTAELEAKIAQLEAKLANLSNQVKPAETKPAPAPEPKPQQRPAASGPTHGTLPAGMKPAEAPKPAPAPEPKPQQRPAASGPTHGTLPAGMKPAEAPKPAPETTTSHPQEPSAGEVAPAYAQISSTGYTGNKYFATRKRLSYHPMDKQFTGNPTVTTTAPPAPQPQHESHTSTTPDTLPAETKPQEKKSLWKAKGSDVAETYVGEDEPKPQQRPAASGPTHGTLPAGMKPAEAPKPAPAPEPKPQQRPAASGPTHGTLPAGMKPAEAPKPAPETTTSHPQEPSAGEVAPAYAQISSTGYTGNKYFATRKRLSYHPMDKQFTGSSTSTGPQVAAEPPKPKSTFRTTLPAGFKA